MVIVCKTRTPDRFWSISSVPPPNSVALSAAKDIACSRKDIPQCELVVQRAKAVIRRERAVIRRVKAVVRRVKANKFSRDLFWRKQNASAGKQNASSRKQNASAGKQNAFSRKQNASAGKQNAFSRKQNAKGVGEFQPRGASTLGSQHEKSSNAESVGERRRAPS